MAGIFAVSDRIIAARICLFIIHGGGIAMAEETKEIQELEERDLAEEVLTLLKEKRFSALREMIAMLPSADIGVLFSEIPTEYHRLFYRLLPMSEYAEKINPKKPLISVL